MKKIITKILCVILFVSCSLCLFVNTTTSNARASSVYDFANITEEESLQFLEDHNINIPEDFRDDSDLGNFVQGIIRSVYNNPSYELVFNYNVTLDFANEIKSNVIPYLNDQVSLLSNASNYSLQYNTVQDKNGNWVTQGGAWKDKWENYNCYAFAINRTEQPRFYQSSKQYDPGDLSGESFSRSLPIEEIANIVKADLLAIGYTNVELSTSIPNINSNQQLICVRKGGTDYHFMKYDLSTDYWYHKPGQSAVLRYNYVPNNADAWKREVSVDGGQYLLDDYEYDGDIYFIKYDKNKVDLSYSTSNLSYSLNVQAGKDSILEISNEINDRYCEFNISATSAVKAELYNNDMELLDTFTGTSILFDKSLSKETYYLKLNYVNTSSSGKINIDIMTSPHSHVYNHEIIDDSYHAISCECGYYKKVKHVYKDHECRVCGYYRTSHVYNLLYSWYDYTRHYASCSCGARGLSVHVVSSDAYSNGERYATCLLCGGKADLAHNVVTSNSLATTSNGSFILPNGVIVLTDEDFEAYINGTLTFTQGNYSYI